VYRRFSDKTALLEAVVLATVEDIQASVLRTLTPALAEKEPLPALLRALIDSMIKSHRTHAGVIRCIRQVWQASEHQTFRKKVVRTEARTLEHVIEVLLTYRKEIHHPDPALAISLTLTALSSTLLELLVIDVEPGTWPPFVPQDEAGLCQELTRMSLRYLGHKDA
jgi:AcrR family transcriptional regulator